MLDNQQFEQLMLQYQQLKNGSEDILKMIEDEDIDGAITMTKARESIFLNCKCIRKFLELTPDQQKEVDKIVDEIRELEIRNMKELGKRMDDLKTELVKTQKAEKINTKYDVGIPQAGSIINIQE